MAVMSTAKDSIMVVTLQVGLSQLGAPVLRQRSHANVVVAAPDQDVFDVANALYALQQYPVTEVRRDNRFELVNIA
ncbi:DUF1659 domain-containing protein [Desulfitobacterium metallireducens]|uniref:DUF1659 domain-containing protein n=1 Tax=Desulfitobacterium metallireducens DSM 15288 TaxID=871968 RepID=W0EET9_9FIRM|nr:DUF1659 domain-containing protein [Desulfitobacterium metallireducens]AHF08043.1 hypothetical protein DESME_14140 [Desulfitobacterium metallireducens DSM 15288]